MDWRAEIREAIDARIRQLMMDGALQATVKSVDKQAGTIVATGVKEDVDYFDVRLKAVLADSNGRGVLAYPVVGSAVSIVLLDGIDTMAFVSQMSDIESYKVTADNGVSIELTTAGKLLLNGDAFKGVVKVTPLVNKVNALETAVNTLKTQMASHTHSVLTLAGAPFPVVAAPIPTLASTPLVPTQAIELENPNVKHG